MMLVVAQVSVFAVGMIKQLLKTTQIQISLMRYTVSQEEDLQAIIAS